MFAVGPQPSCPLTAAFVRAWLLSAALTIPFILLLFPTSTPAERKPVRIYTTADGLPSNGVACNKRDSHGFLWFCTTEGLSRFDGYAFTNYGVDQGLPDRMVTDLVETRDGEYWVGTAHGLARFNPKPGSKEALFTVYGLGSDRTLSINALLEDRQGIVWVGTDIGVLQLVKTNGQWVLSQPDLNLLRDAPVEHLLQDAEGNIWIAVYQRSEGAQLWRRAPDGRLDLFQDEFLRARGVFGGNRIVAITEDLQKNIWLGTYRGLALLVPRPQPGRQVIEHVYAKWDPLMGPDSFVGSVFQSSDGRRWVNTASAAGTFQMLGDPHGKIHFKLFDHHGGINLQDIGGNFWFGNTRRPPNGFVSYDHADGLATDDVRSVFEGHDGQLYVVTGLHNRYIHRFDGERFIPVAPKMPGHDTSWDWLGWGWGQIHLQDHLGEWWVATGVGLLRYPRVDRLEDLAHTAPKAVYREVADIFRLYEDSRGDIWIGSWSGTIGSALTRWQRSTQRFYDVRAREGWRNDGATAFCEDRAGNLWVARWTGGLSRYREGHFTWVVQPDSYPTGSIYSIFLDHAGRLWAATTRSGLIRVDDPTADHPGFKVYSTKEGLSSNDVRAITEDHFGRIYFWTGRGVDRLDPNTGSIRHYTEADGLIPAASDHNVAFCDRHGTLWFGLKGLSRLDPEPDHPSQPPPIRITRLRIGGTEYPISELGETDLAGLVLQPNQNQIQVEFASLNFAVGDLIRYQYRLVGAVNEWSDPSDLRTVNYPRLPPGTYRFEVRAVNSEGLMSPVQATIVFRLLPPVWGRWWFLTAAGLFVAFVVHWAHRHRVQQALELERVRTRIATDLHDDIGSSLTQIAIMSEVARRQGTDGHSSEPLVRIGNLSRELVDSMSDIVWAINPKRDHLSDLTHRMRRFASDVLEGADVKVAFRTIQETGDSPLHADTRREVFLVFKESVNNVARHAKCNHVDIVVNLKRSHLLMTIHDDGQGFQGKRCDGQGHGIASMRERARRLGGKLEITSEPGKGTTLILSVRLNHSGLSARSS